MENGPYRGLPNPITETVDLFLIVCSFDILVRAYNL